jgi:hypothetical protein
MKLAIKIENNIPVEHPVSINNLKQIFDISKINIDTLNGIGYAPFLKSEIPRETIRDKVVDHGYILDEYGYVRHSYSHVTKSIDELDVDILLNNKLGLLKDEFNRVSLRPIIDTELGFSVEGGINDLNNFKIGKRKELLIVKDSINTIHEINITDYDIIIDAIEIKRLSLLQLKWDTESILKNIDLSNNDGIVEFDNIIISDVFKTVE